jgi:hypothetical protein
MSDLKLLRQLPNQINLTLRVFMYCQMPGGTTSRVMSVRDTRLKKGNFLRYICTLKRTTGIMLVLLRGHIIVRGKEQSGY